MGEFLAASLQLVYPPISNKEGDWLYELPEVRNIVKLSKLYMIGKRSRLYFTYKRYNKGKRRAEFILSQNTTRQKLPFHLYANEFLKGTAGRVIDFHCGDKIIKIFEPGHEQEEPLAWFTPDKLLYDHWRGALRNTGLASTRHFTTFKLLYVGISKEGDSLSRLYEQGHKSRTKILSQEDQVEPGVSISEEIMLFLFKLVPRRIRTLDIANIARAQEPLTPPDQKKLAADAEKAFAHILQCQYNKERYANYPRGMDGLFGEGLDRYLYWIGEDITFRTDTGNFVGYRDESKRSSMIVIQGETVTLVEP